MPIDINWPEVLQNRELIKVSLLLFLLGFVLVVFFVAMLRAFMCPPLPPKKQSRQKPPLPEMVSHTPNELDSPLDRVKIWSKQNSLSLFVVGLTAASPFFLPIMLQSYHDDPGVIDGLGLFAFFALVSGCYVFIRFRVAVKNQKDIRFVLMFLILGVTGFYWFYKQKTLLEESLNISLEYELEWLAMLVVYLGLLGVLAFACLAFYLIFLIFWGFKK